MDMVDIYNFYYISHTFTQFYEEGASQTIPELLRMLLEYCGSHLWEMVVIFGYLTF